MVEQHIIERNTRLRNKSWDIIMDNTNTWNMEEQRKKTVKRVLKQRKTKRDYFKPENNSVTPFACLGEGCRYVTGHGWESIKAHMKSCLKYCKTKPISILSSKEKAQDLLSVNMAVVENGHLFQTVETSEPFACLGEECSYKWSTWSSAITHMKCCDEFDGIPNGRMN